MVTHGGKNLVAGLFRTHLGQHLMSKVFNAKREPSPPSPLRLLRLLRPLRLRLIPIHIIFVENGEIHGNHVQIAILMSKPMIIFTLMNHLMELMKTTHAPTAFQKNVILISSIELVKTVSGMRSGPRTNVKVVGAIFI